MLLRRLDIRYYHCLCAVREMERLRATSIEKSAHRFLNWLVIQPIHEAYLPKQLLYACSSHPQQVSVSAPHLCPTAKAIG